MNCNPTLTSQEFSDIHNAKCEIHSIANSLEGVVSDRLYARLEKAIALLNKGLERAYELDDAAFEKNSVHYDEVSKQHGFKTVWSVYEVTNLYSLFEPVATHVLYKNHWGESEVLVPIKGTSWVDVWIAAEQAILNSGDMHHIFIEAFKLNDNGYFELSTGS